MITQEAKMKVLFEREEAVIYNKQVIGNNTTSHKQEWGTMAYELKQYSPLSFPNS